MLPLVVAILANIKILFNLELVTLKTNLPLEKEVTRKGRATKSKRHEKYVLYIFPLVARYIKDIP